jgi:uncharacterized protein YggE
MKHFIIAAALAVFMTGPALAQSTSNERVIVVRLVEPTPAPAPTPPVTLALSGDGLVERAPDLARLFVTIVTNDDAASASSSKNNDVYNAFKARTAGLGLAADAIRTTGYNVVFVPHPPRGLPPEQQQPRYGYVTTRSIIVTVTPIENIGQAVDAATAAGVTNVGAITFDLKDRKSAYKAALEAAMNDVKQTAALLAATGGFTIGKIQSINVNGNVPLQTIGAVRAFSRAPSSDAAPTTPTDIQPGGPISVSAHVNVTYVIKQ